MRAVTLDAVVTNVERVHRGEDVEYDVYVTYRYEGIDYSACYKSSTDEEWFDRIGVKVSVVIDSEEPDVLIEDLLDGAFFAFFFGLPIFAAGFYFVGLPVRKSYTEFYGSSSEAIMADWVSEERRKLLWLSLFVYSVGEIVWGVYMGDIGGAFSANVLLGFMVAPFWIVLLVRYIIKVVKTKDCAQNYVKSS